MKRGAALFLSLLMVLLVQAPAFAGNDAEVCHTPGGDQAKARTLRVNHHALPALQARGGSEGPCDSVVEPPADEEPPVENSAPVAEATYTVNGGMFGDSVFLDGSASYDPDGDTLTFSWQVVDGDGFVVTFATATAGFTATSYPYTVILTVSDGELTDSTTFTIE